MRGYRICCRLRSYRLAGRAKPDYGIDAPPVVWALSLCGIAALLVAALGPKTVTVGLVTFVVKPMFYTTGALLLIEAAAMIFYAKYGKFVHRDRMLRMHQWRGDEQVLDVGTGRGLLMIGAAHHVPAGHSVGIDIWSAKDLSGNTEQNALRNAELEGVRDRVEAITEDASKMSFPDGSFDVVMSNLCIHNIPSREGREKACREIIRVLKPGGKALISDYRHTRRYAELFREAGARVTVTPLDPFTFPFLRIVEAVKQ